MQASTIFSREDLSQIATMGMTAEAVLAQLEILARGFPYTTLQHPCTGHDGIRLIDEAEVETLTVVDSQAAADGRVMSFVPASGAASRMFKPLLTLRNRYQQIDKELILTKLAEGDTEARDFVQFINDIKRFAFYADLTDILSQNGHDLEALLDHGQYTAILEHLLTAQGLNYSNLPKGLLQFHRYKDHPRTPFEEHLVKSTIYIKNSNNVSQLHFTVSPQHMMMVKDHIDFIEKTLLKMRF